jgi:hypothetical protein
MHDGGFNGFDLSSLLPPPLLVEVRDHFPPLRTAGLVTERSSIVMRTKDGTVIEIFEWVSPEAIANAHFQSRGAGDMEALRGRLHV